MTPATIHDDDIDTELHGTVHLAAHDDDGDAGGDDDGDAGGGDDDGGADA